MLAALLTVTWTGGTILIRRGRVRVLCHGGGRRDGGTARGRAGLVVVAGVAALVMAAAPGRCAARPERLSRDAGAGRSARP